MSSKTELKRYYAKDRRTWRTWLEKNHQKSPGVWLIYYRTAVGKPRVSYNDAVEEALCFGWIDSTIKPIDDEKYMQRFTPRKPKSGWSTLNKQRIKKLVKEGLMTEAGNEKIVAAKKDGSWKSLDHIYTTAKNLEIPADLKEALVKQEGALKNFYNYSISVRTQFLYWINDAKRPETRSARINQSALMSAAGRKPSIKGFVL